MGHRRRLGRHGRGTTFKKHWRHKRYSARPRSRMVTCKVKLFDRRNRPVSYRPYIGTGRNHRVACKVALRKCHLSTNLYGSVCRIQ